MSGRVISIDEFAMTVEQLVEENIDKAESQFKKDITAAANTATNVVKSSSPVRTGKYAAGWKKKIEGTDATGFSAVIYNSSKPSLTHLLEKGHQKVLWGHETHEKVDPAPPNGHINKGFDAGAAELLRRLGK